MRLKYAELRCSQVSLHNAIEALRPSTMGPNIRQQPVTDQSGLWYDYDECKRKRVASSQCDMIEVCIGLCAYANPKRHLGVNSHVV